MMEYKKVLVGLLLTSSLSFVPMLAQANDFIISNATPNELTFSVNGVCSPEFGVVDYSVKVIPEANFKKSCQDNATCDIKAYAGKHCVGTFAGGVLSDAEGRNLSAYPGNHRCVYLSGVSVGRVQSTTFFTATGAPKC